MDVGRECQRSVRFGSTCNGHMLCRICENDTNVHLTASIDLVRDRTRNRCLAVSQNRNSIPRCIRGKCLPRSFPRSLDSRPINFSGATAVRASNTRQGATDRFVEVASQTLRLERAIDQVCDTRTRCRRIPLEHRSIVSTALLVDFQRGDEPSRPLALLWRIRVDRSTTRRNIILRDT